MNINVDHQLLKSNHKPSTHQTKPSCHPHSRVSAKANNPPILKAIIGQKKSAHLTDFKVNPRVNHPNSQNKLKIKKYITVKKLRPQ